jgi:hypothetical protein
MFDSVVARADMSQEVGRVVLGISLWRAIPRTADRRRERLRVVLHPPPVSVVDSVVLCEVRSSTVMSSFSLLAS